MLEGRLAAGPEVPHVVGVRAIHDDGAAGALGDGAKDAVELVLAVEAAHGAVRDVVRVVHLVGFDELVADADAGGERRRLLALRGRDGRGDAGDRRGAVAERLVGHGGEEGGVDPTGEGDDDALVRAEVGEEGGGSRISHYTPC